MATPSTSNVQPRGLIGWLTHGRLSPRAAHRLGLLAVLAGVCLVAALVAGGDRGRQEIPVLDRDDLGRPFESVGSGGFKAAREFVLPDVEGTARRRAEAEDEVRPVFDLNPGVHEDLRTRIRVAFQHVREQRAVAPPAVADGTVAPASESAPVQPVPSEADENATAAAPALPTGSTQPAAGAAADPGELRAAFETALFGVARDGLEDADYRALMRANFSEAIEEAILILVAQAYTLPLVNDRADLEREAPGGLMLRNVRSRAEVPYEVGRAEVRDLDDAREALERYASVPGNTLPDRPGLERRAALRIASRLLRPDLTINAAETEARRKAAAQAVKPSTLVIKKGQRVIGDGELITEQHLELLNGMRAEVGPRDRIQQQLGGATLVALAALGAWLFCQLTFRRWRIHLRDAVFMGLMLSGSLGLAAGWLKVTEPLRDGSLGLPEDALAYVLPIAGAAMVVRFVLNSRPALYFALVQAAVVGVLLQENLGYLTWALVGSLVGMALISRVQDRSGILKASLITGAVNGLLVLVLRLSAGEGLSGDVVSAAFISFIGSGMTSALVVIALTPLAESIFGYASNIRLLELANLNHPALKELIVQAPGTYHHSIIMGTMVEKAAAAIGANPLLARTCAYYHDIGKGRNPLYFGENQQGENRHDALSPALSATIIKRHVADGLEMARHYGLPRIVADAIPEHHGTRTVGTFLKKARQEAAERPELKVDEELFHYPGPKPQSRETALVMISDAVEATCRMLPEPTPPKLQARVQQTINVVFTEGQLDECDLTLKDLHLISDSFVRTLQGIYHSRPEIPGSAGRMGRAPEPRQVAALPTTPPDEVEPEVTAPIEPVRPTGSV
ncbi:MAG TPA: HDIG domain-containing protein [Myxococcaceae bacterium]|nr:HDIG domain-containing protein [Myxococcaceae bacterium]